MDQILAGFVLLIMISAIGAILYKYRDYLKKWIKDPEVGGEYHIPRKTRLQRKIEDAEAELAWLEEKERKQS